MSNSYTRALSVLVLFTITAYGMFRVWVLKIYAEFLDWFASLFGYSNNFIFEIVKNQAKKETVREQTLGWIIYYPTYFLLHIVFISLLFSNNSKARTNLILALLSLVGSLFFLWVLFLNLDMPETSWFFRDQLKKLFGLPFILLAIEGGRILYKDVTKLVR